MAFWAKSTHAHNVRQKQMNKIVIFWHKKYLAVKWKERRQMIFQLEKEHRKEKKKIMEEITRTKMQNMNNKIVATKNVQKNDGNDSDKITERKENFAKCKRRKPEKRRRNLLF